MDKDYIKIPLTTNQDSDNSNISRWDKQKGHFSLTIAALLSADGKSVNLRNSLMPLGPDGDIVDLDPNHAVLADQISQGNPILITQNPAPEIRLAFTTMGRFTALGSRLQDYINENSTEEYQVIGVTAFWQPKNSYDKIFTNGAAPAISKFLVNNRKLKFEERGYIDAHNVEVVEILEQTRQLMVDTVLEAGLKLDTDSIINDYKPQHACSILANRYPFILQHIFKYLPNLNILKLGLNVLGSENAIYVYRHHPEWFSGATLLRSSALRNIDLEIVV